MILEPQEATGEALAYTFEPQDLGSPYTREQILAIVLQDIRLAEQMGHERERSLRWDEDDRLYLFQVPQQRWEGTNVPRASLGVPLVLEHVNALNPQVMDVIFEEDPPFAAIPYPGTDPNVARAYEYLLEQQIAQADVESELTRTSFSGLFRGTGIAKCYWGVKGKYKCPKFEFIERKHILVDPSLRVPDLRKAKWVAHRMMLTPKQLDKLRNVSGYENIPSLHDLRALALPPTEVPATNSIDAPIGSFGSTAVSTEWTQFERQQQPSKDPDHTPLEVIEYWNQDWVWTVLQQKIVIRVLKNKDSRWAQKVMYLSVPFIEAEGFFDGIGLAQLLGGEQKLQQGILNGLLDGVSLSLNGMFKRRRGSSILPQQARVSPGRVIDVDTMDDLEAIEMPQPSTISLDALERSDMRSARRSGANEVAVQGAFPSAGSGGIGRTAYGMNMLAQASSARIRKYVKDIERQILIPFLEWLADTNVSNMDPAWIQEILSPQLMEAFQMTSQQLLYYGSKFKFKILAATKMKRRSSLFQAVPFLTEFFQQPTTQEHIKSQYKKFNFDELVNMVMDSTGWPNKSTLIQDMSEEEIQQLQSQDELVREMAILREKAKIESNARINEIDAKASGQAMNQVVKAALEDGAMRDQMSQDMLYMKGQEMANRELDAEMQQLGMTGGMQNGSTQEP